MQPFEIAALHRAIAQNGGLAIWTVYDHPTDHPHGFIARMHVTTSDGSHPTEATIEGTLDQIRTTLEDAGLTPLTRHPHDQRHIVESWI